MLRTRRRHPLDENVWGGWPTNDGRCSRTDAVLVDRRHRSRIVRTGRPDLRLYAPDVNHDSQLLTRRSISGATGAPPAAWLTVLMRA